MSGTPRKGRAFFSAVDAAHQHVLDVDELIDTVVRALAADAGFLDAAERRDLS